ncbi:MAG TPA: GldG family protein [Bryobacteraceae bacterium]|nr:GldG family protein [Bryobacteraceae bacterium]
MNTSWLSARQTRFTAYVTLYILIVVAALGLLNWLANRHNKSVDTTANKRFSLSDQTEKVVKGLKDDVRISYWDRSSEFPRARDMLDRYDTQSTKLHVDYVDPARKPQEARAAGIRTEGTIFVQVGSRREEAKSLTEEEITGALIRTLKGGQRTVCAVQGSGEHSFDDTGREGYARAKETIERNNYRTRSISLLEKPEVPKDCTVLVVGGPRYDYVAPAVNAIRTYVEAGGRALILLDPPLQSGKEPVAANEALVSQLASWGVTANRDLVLDISGVGQVFGFSAAVPLVASYESHPIVGQMRGVATAFPLARSLEAKSAGKATADKLFGTSENSFATTNLAATEIDPASGRKGPFTLGAAVTWNTGQGNAQGRVVVTGSSAWIGNGIINFNGNRDLMMNMLNWLSSDEDLISIRPKDPEDRRLSLTRQQMHMIFYTSVLLIPLAVVGAGVSVWWKRR